jgi:hypothetical protein
MLNLSQSQLYPKLLSYFIPLKNSDLKCWIGLVCFLEEGIADQKSLSFIKYSIWSTYKWFKFLTGRYTDNHTSHHVCISLMPNWWFLPHKQNPLGSFTSQEFYYTLPALYHHGPPMFIFSQKLSCHLSWLRMFP